jgi:hypothetical protein
LASLILAKLSDECLVRNKALLILILVSVERLVPFLTSFIFTIVSEKEVQPNIGLSLPILPYIGLFTPVKA